jgi:membrane fusion protein, multidrug efflux system
MSEPENEPAALSPVASAALAAAPRRTRGRWFRYVLMAALPLALVAGGGWYWITSGRWASTENAYVQQNRVLVAPEVEGRIASVLVGQNQTVKPGDILFRIDDAAYRIALEKADGAVALARLQVEELRTRLKDVQLKADTARNTFAFQEAQFNRQDRLRNTGNTTEAQYESARHELDLARQAVAEAEQGVADALVALDGDANIETDKHPSVLGALAAQDSARLDLERTMVRAPTTGTVSQVGNLQVGQYIGSGSPVMAIIDTTSAWVEANFKETDLGHMRRGQPAELTLDAYPDKTIKGHVESFGGGTGAIFSLLPAQNATGNWVKVVQRVPVRVALDEPTTLPLKAGLSVGVEVDTGFVRPLPAFLRTALDTLGIATTPEELAVK